MRKFNISILLMFIIISISNSGILFNNFYNNTKMIDITFAEKTIKIKCTEMSCNACKQSITRSLKTVQGINKLDVDLETKIITVVIDDSKTDEQEVLNAIIGAGYEAEIIKQ